MCTRRRRKDFDRDFPNILATISGGSSIEPIQLEVESATVEELLDEASTSIERMYALVDIEICRL